VVIGTDCTGSYKSNYHTITITNAPSCNYNIPEKLLKVMIILTSILSMTFGMWSSIKENRI